MTISSDNVPLQPKTRKPTFKEFMVESDRKTPPEKRSWHRRTEKASASEPEHPPTTEPAKAAGGGQLQKP
jgi:hypothetical protein